MAKVSLRPAIIIRTLLLGSLFVLVPPTRARATAECGASMPPLLSVGVGAAAAAAVAAVHRSKVNLCSSQDSATFPSMRSISRSAVTWVSILVTTFSRDWLSSARKHLSWLKLRSPTQLFYTILARQQGCPRARGRPRGRRLLGTGRGFGYIAR